MDIRGQYAASLPDIKQAVADVIESGRFILGPHVRSFEEEAAAELGARHGVAVGNGTDALVLGLEALGIGRGDEVITTPYTFYATAEAIARVGATPVFADIKPDTLNLDPAAAEAAITDRTRALMVVHVFGQAADLGAFRELADRYGLALIEDAAQAFGSSIDGREAGSVGDVATFSFYPTKNLPAMGDAGLVVTSSDELAERVRRLRMDEIQAAVLRLLLPQVRGWNDARRSAAARYRQLGLGELVQLPVEPSGRRHVYHLYMVRSDRRDALARGLRDAGVGAAVYYETPLHLQPVFESLGHRPGDFPVTEKAGREGLALPMFPTLTEGQQREVVDAVRAALVAAAA
jgi:dTDP-4-amino-4,6-dideoxygalactose transaminase